MVDSGTIILASASVTAGVVSSIALVEYRLFREKQRERRERKLRWTRRTITLTDQVIRECRDISAFTQKNRTQFVDDQSHPIFDRIQELKDALSEAPEDLPSNTEYFMRDTWVKFEMAGFRARNPDWAMIDGDVKPQAEKAKEGLETYLEEEIKKDSLFSKVKTKIQNIQDNLFTR